MKKLRKGFQDRLADAGTQAEENLSSIRTVRTFSGETKACNSYGADVDKSYDMGKKLSMLGGEHKCVVCLIVESCTPLFAFTKYTALDETKHLSFFTFT